MEWRTEVSTKAIRMAAQRSMKEAGYYTGEIDGDWGPKSKAGWAAVLADQPAPGASPAAPPSNVVAGPWPLQTTADLSRFYGNPNGGGSANSQWEADNLVYVTPPYRMVLAWDPSTVVTKIRVHRKVADSVLRILNAIKDHYGSQAAIEAARMHLYGGAYAYRPKRGGSSLSVHSYGCAIDLDPERNGYGVKYDERKGMMPAAVVAILQAEGWVWGGRWSKADAMHFQAARI